MCDLTPLAPDANLDMTEIQTDVWNGFIFIRLKPMDEQSLEDYLEPVSTSLKDYPFAELTRREWYSVDETVNWKVLLDAQLEGWHVPFLHRNSLARSTSAAGMLLRHSILEVLGPHGLVGTEPPPVFNPTPTGQVSLKYGIGAYDAFAFTEPRRTDAKKYHLRGAMNLYFIFPNVIMGLMRDSYWMYNVWPLAVDRTIWEIGVNTVPPRNAGELFCQEYNKIGLRDTLMEDTATHEKIQQVLKSGAKEHFHFQDEELALRNFHYTVDACLAAAEEKRGQTTFFPVFPGSVRLDWSDPILCSCGLSGIDQFQFLPVCQVVDVCTTVIKVIQLCVYCITEVRMLTISVKIPVHLDKQLARISKQRGLSRSTILRDAISAYVAEPDNSFSARASDLAGSLTGPEDLSTSAEYMAEYGR